MTIRAIGQVLGAVLLSAMTASVLAAVPRYDVACLDCGTGLRLMPLGINRIAVIVATDAVGCSFPNDCDRGQGYVINHGTITKTPAFDEGLGSTALALNASDVVVGSASKADFPQGPFGYSWDGANMTDLGDPLNQQNDTYFSHAMSINDAGHIVGTAADGYHSVAVFFYADGAMTHVPLVDASYVEASYIARINASDHVSGTGFWSNDDQRFAWISQDGVTQVLAPGVPESEAYAINDADEVVGYVQPTVNIRPTAAALWKNGTMTLLNTLAGYGDTGQANSINNLGWVVGNACGSAGCTTFVYNGRKLFDLNARLRTAGWILSNATGINDAGIIVGTGRRHGKTHAFIAIPR
jgi:uncharacterized membrane protein